MAAGPEAQLVAKIKKTVQERYPQAWVIKNHGSAYSTAGVPDLLIIIDGAAVLLEVKAPKAGESAASVMSRVTPIQMNCIEQIRKAGGVAEVVWDVAQALDVLNSLIPKKDRGDVSKDIRLNSLAATENAMRKSVEHLEAELQHLRVENDLLRSGKGSPHANIR